jgi:hypothetical protein
LLRRIIRDGAGVPGQWHRTRAPGLLADHALTLRLAAVGEVSVDERAKDRVKAQRPKDLNRRHAHRQREQRPGRIGDPNRNGAIIAAQPFAQPLQALQMRSVASLRQLALGEDKIDAAALGGLEECLLPFV